KQILHIVATENLPTARNRLDAIAKRYPSSPDVLYLQALLTENGDTALQNYTRLYSNNKASRFAPEVIYKIAQFNYAKGDYKRARLFFSHIVSDYPHSELRIQAQYFAAKMLLAQSQLDQAKSELKKVVKNSKNNETNDIAKEDPAYIDQLHNVTRATPADKSTIQPPVKKTNEEIRFAVQIGAFGDRENAISQRDYYKRFGYASEILAFKTRTGTLYRVILGRFATELEARRFGKQIQSLHNIKYRILKTTIN
ncbi:MAG: hypothetical protein DWQ10_08425, partial [Calditrichaeota bacterium]